MRLRWFEVQGYKNIRAPLRLGDLGRINVFHGDNNVGKSNLLEVVGLLFVLLHALREDARGGPGLAERYARWSKVAPAGAGPRSTVRSLEYFTKRGFPPEEIFDLRSAQPIEVRAQLELDGGDRDEADPSWMQQPLELGLRLEHREDELVVTLARLAHEGGVDLAAATGDEADADRARVIERLGPRRRGEAFEPRFALIRADRTIVAEPGSQADEASPLASREPLPQDLGLALHDASTATGLPRERFDRFVAALGHFRGLLGDGRWQMQYDRRKGRAELVFEGAGERIPLRLMGSGVQQIAALVARLLLTGADMVAIEEPELNLRWSAQHALREVLAAVVGEAGGPSQILVTSHSAAFEFEPLFYLLERTPDGPRVSQRPVEEAPRWLNPEVEIPPPGARAPVSYVTTDGLVRVPEYVRKELGLEQGGGVAFVREKDHGHYRMLSDAQLLDMIEPRETKP